MSTEAGEHRSIGRYRLSEFVRTSRYGEVWHAWDSLLQRKVTIQTLELGHGWNVTAFLRESSVLANFLHPSILRVYEVGKDTVNGTLLLYLVMEFADQGSLGDRLRLGPLAQGAIGPVLEQICSGLDYIHSRGLIHGNLRPQNILFDSYGRVLLTAFDLDVLAAKIDLSNTHYEEAHRAPEASLGSRNLQPQSDIYSLGIVLHQMLTGKLPRRVSTDPQQVILEDPLPSELRSVLEKATRFHPNDRYQSAKELFEAFNEATLSLLQAPTQPLDSQRADSISDEESSDSTLAGRMTSILFLAADPSDASRLRLGEEAREIQEKLQLARLRERFELHYRTSVRPADISQALLDVEPKVVHFSGHGTTTGALCFENQMGKTHPIQPEALAALFEQFSDRVKCVVLNACYSETQANAIAQHIDYVIGMNQTIGDEAAIAFAIGFYQALGAGRTIEGAYKLGCVQIRLQGISRHLAPVLIKHA